MPKSWQWTPEEQAQAERSHAESYLQIARAVDELYLHGGTNVATGLAVFDAEVAHIRAGQVWAAMKAEQDDEAARPSSDYSEGVAYLIRLRFSARDQLRWLEQGTTAACILADNQALSIHLGNLGNAYADLGEVQEAIAYIEQALAIHKEIGDRRGEGNDLGNLGAEYFQLGEVHNDIAPIGWTRS